MFLNDDKIRPVGVPDLAGQWPCGPPQAIYLVIGLVTYSQ
jgi:hypothetical protein